jgi:hypothetical protein
MATALPVDHAREISLSPHPSTEGRFAAPWHPRAGLGAFPLHLHRTMDERAPFNLDWKNRAMLALKFIAPYGHYMIHILYIGQHAG